MKSFSIVAALSAAFVALPAFASTPLDYDDARHLLNRTGFGATDAEIRRMIGMTREEAARTLLAATRTSAVTAPPAWTNDAGPLRYPRRGVDASEIEKVLVVLSGKIQPCALLVGERGIGKRAIG